MLTETKNVPQVKGEPKRRWFADQLLDLVVWFNQHDEIVGFQLCYGRLGERRALTWKKSSSYFHDRIDDGEEHPLVAKCSPILVADGPFEQQAIAERFKEESGNIDPQIASFVYSKILEYPLAKGSGESGSTKDDL